MRRRNNRREGNEEWEGADNRTRGTKIEVRLQAGDGEKRAPIVVLQTKGYDR
jgi:hypothetical protein